jgi:uncharacterized protein YecE (DUF72 family)
MGRARVGISGWTYKPWRGVFYPKGLVQKRELEYASRQMDTIEINGSFYSLQRPSSYRHWYEETPDDFIFAVKGSRFITHMKKLKDVDVPLANFFASGVLRLAEKLGPILWQFPPQLRFDYEKFARFLDMLPRTTRDAATLARRHDARLDDRAWTHAEHQASLRYTFEIRHDSFLEPSFMELLRQHNAAFCVADTAGHFPFAEEVTADFVYVRLHGAEKLYTSGYSDDQLEWWASRVRKWQRSGDVYVYFDNDAKVHAPFDAMKLTSILAGKDERKKR